MIEDREVYMTGCLYGVGVGPGDPELLTLKAVRTMKECDVIVVPGELPKETIAWKIAVQACPEMEEKEVIGISMPMTKDKAVLEESQRKGADTIKSYLDQGKDVAFLTLGDPTIYSTYLYVHKLIGEVGYQTEIINGIPSFCAAAASLNIGLSEQEEQIHIIPASYDVEDALVLPGNKILMKAGKQLPKVVQEIRETGQSACAVENCSMKDEKIYKSIEEFPDEAGYLVLTIVKEHK